MNTLRTANTIKALSKIVFGTFIALSIQPASLSALEKPDTLPAEAGVIERLNSSVDLGLSFTSTDNKEVTLQQLALPNRPILITPVYFGCPNLCTYTLNAIVKLLNELDLTLGKDFSLVSYSIDPSETSELSKPKSEAYFAELKRPADGAAGWHFLTGSEENTRKLSANLGFQYAKDGEEFSHSAAFMILTPDGRISRYFYGVEYRPRDVRLALVEASQGRIGNTLEKVFLFCFRYDHIEGRYTPLVWNITRIICLGFAAIIVVTLVVLRTREKHYQRRREHAGVVT